MIVGVNDAKHMVRLISLENDSFTAIIGARRETVRIYQQDQTIFVHDLRGVHTLTAIPYLTYISAAAETSGELRAPMMGMILQVNIADGDRIKVGDVAAILGVDEDGTAHQQRNRRHRHRGQLPGGRNKWSATRLWW